MKARVVSQYSAKLMPEPDGITEEGFRHFLNWSATAAELNERVVTPFREALRAEAGWSDEKRPAEEVAANIPAGEVLFAVATAPTVKRPAYKEVVGEFSSYLGVLSDQYARDIRRREIVTIDGQPYVSTADLRQVIEAALATKLSGKDGIKQEDSLVSPEELEELLDELSIPLRRNYAALSDYNARLYVHAGVMRKEGNSRASAFKALVKEDSLEAAEKDDTITVVSYVFDGFDVVHQMEKRTAPKYGDVVDAFVAPAPKKLTSRSRIGDFARAELYCTDDAFRSYAEEKGLADSEFVVEYAPRRRDSLVYVPLGTVRSRLERYLKEKASNSLEQNFQVVLK